MSAAQPISESNKKDSKAEQSRPIFYLKDTNGGPMCPIGVNGGKVHSAVEDGQSAEYSPNARRATMSAGDSSQNQFTMARTKLAELIRMRARKSFRTARKASAMDDPEMFGGSVTSQTEKDGFGWITGVLIRCILCIFGATLFLRMSWVAGQAGLILGTVVVLLSFLVVVVTAISMSAIATNGEVKNGGCYYLISRSLGPEFGGSIGLILYIANTVNASMNCVGLAEAMVRLLKDDYGIQLIDGGINDIRIYAICTCLLLQAIIFIGTEFENKTQLALMGTIWVCIVSHFVGTLLPLSEVQRRRGVVGFSFGVLLDNLWPDFRGGNTFITMFGVYFPAMTGIMAGANMSGDLKDPSKSTLRPTLACMVVTAMTTLRDATGYSEPELHPATHRYIPASCRANLTCKFGLANDYDVMTLQGAWAPLITVGVFSTTLSSASGCLIGAPRILQALCADKLFPYMHPFAKGHRKTNDPFRAYILTLLIAISAIMIGELNLIADLISNFFLAAFAITNFACFDASAAKSPGFRPGFRFYNKWLSLFGSALCVLIMFVLNWPTSLVTFLVFFVLFVFIKHNKSHINWGTSTEANRYRRALNSLLKISRTEDHVKNYRPQLLVLSGNPVARQALVDFAYCISNGRSLLLCGHIVPHRSSVQATALIRSLNNRFTDWLYEQHIKGFYCAVAHQSLRDGVQCLLQTVGLGKMHPNILLIGFNSHWLGQCDVSNRAGVGDWYKEYMGVIADAFEANMAVCVFRNENDGLDHSALLSEEDKLFVRLPDLLLSDRNSSLIDDLNRGVGAKKVRPKAKAQQQSALSFSPSRAEFSAPTLIDRLPTTQCAASPSGDSTKANGHTGGKKTAAKGPRKVSSGAYMRKNEQFRSAAGRHPMSAKFRTQIKGGFVDVWWLHDDGGLALLLSHLLKEHNTYLPNAKLRIFTICSKLDPDDVYHKLVEMLKKFRIHFTSVHVISEDYDEEKLYQETIEEYQELMNTLNPPGKEQHEQAINQEMIDKTQWKTMRYLRQRELLLEFSSASSIVMISMPFTSANVVLSPVYGMWLELLSRDMPPMLFVRGNRTSVITYYS
uniref:Solute carrier family 12 member 3 n=1 Tax=Globodera rostochiensis TaxID=31243 RepID=A0A914I4H5_GLORO